MRIKIGNEVVFACELGGDEADVWEVVRVLRTADDDYALVDIRRPSELGEVSLVCELEEELVRVNSPLYLALCALGSEYKALGVQCVVVAEGASSDQDKAAKCRELFSAMDSIRLAGKLLLLTWKEGR